MIIVVNTIQTKPGYGDVMLERFKSPRHVHTFPGFVRLEVLLTEGTEGYEEYKVSTTWENKASFDGWLQSDSFKNAHAQRKEAVEGTSPVINTKLTIHEVLVSHGAPALAEH